MNIFLEVQEGLVNAVMEALVPRHSMPMDTSPSEAPPLLLADIPWKRSEKPQNRQKNPKCALNATLRWAESPIFLSRDPF